MDYNVSNTAQVKRHNKLLVLNALKALPQGTKMNVATITGLSVATCNTILNEMTASGEIIEVGNEITGAYGVGRPSSAYRFNENYSYICCIHLTYENKNKILSYAIVNLRGEVLKKNSIVANKIDYSVLERLIEEQTNRYENIKAIGIGIPGVANRRHEIEQCDMKELEGCFLQDDLASRFSMNVVVENDMNLIAYGFYQNNEYPEATSIAAVSFYMDNLPGAGIIVDGKIIKGSTNFAGEVTCLPFGCTIEELAELLHSDVKKIQIIVKTICSLAVIINPEAVVLTGGVLGASMLEDIYTECSKIISARHIPKLSFIESADEYYLFGLISLTLETINQVDERR
jgi:hypothetical protein